MTRYQQWNQQIIDEFRTNAGTVTTAGFGRNLVLLHHVGAKTGQQRVTPVRVIRDGADTWLIAASKGGAPEHPAWYHNLRANPDITIETPDDGTVPVHARVLVGAERDDAWARFTAVSDSFRQYELRTSRTIPVIALHRRTGEATP
jgi:deazaflavin-dependent oxidoreductase (nitroreductase family)